MDITISKVSCDFLVLLATAIPLLIFHEFVPPYKRGFYCDDESIRYPYRDSTISRQMLIVIGILVPTLLIILTEVMRTLAWEKKCASEFSLYHYRKYNVHRLIVRLYIFIGYFFVGVCFNQLMVDVAKYTIGRQRPHFMEVCKPNKGYDNCPPGDHHYITDFECTGQSKYLIHESQLSFYSGHAAFSFYAAWYTTFYLQARIYRPLISKLILPVVQFALFAGAAFVSYTRVSNYKHHWSDVLVGAIMGSAIGIINAIFVAEVFERREIPLKYRWRHRVLGEMRPPDVGEADLSRGQLINMEERLKKERDVEMAQGRMDSRINVKANETPVRVIVHEERIPSVMHPRMGYTNNFTSDQYPPHNR